MKKFTKEQIDKIPTIFKCDWYEEWIKEQKKSKDYLGKLAILVNGQWMTEGIDFKIVG